MKKIIKLLLSIMMVFSFIISQTTVFAQDNEIKTSFLFTNDVHGNVDGYALLAGFKDYSSKNSQDVYLVDAGDAIQGDPIADLSKGEIILDIMNKVGYDFVIPGNHEFSYGVEQLKKIAEESDCGYYSSNFIDLVTNKTVFEPYKVFDTRVGKVALVGITTPESFTKSNPLNFQDKDGKFIYGFNEGNKGEDLYNVVQKNIEDAKNDGAEFVILVGHTGIDEASSPWTSQEIIAHTTGVNAYIDGHSHSTIVHDYTNKNGETVTLAQTGTAFQNIGKIELTKTNNAIHLDAKLFTEEDLEKLNVKPDESIYNFVEDIKGDYSQLLRVVGESEVDLITHDENGKRLVRTSPTNLGDLCADAFRNIMGAEIGFMTGGLIRSNINKGNITYNDVMGVFPINNCGTLIEATGQQILDALEMSLSVWPNENGGYLHTSGITYEFHNYLDSHVVKDEKNAFVRVDGEYRVKNVKVNGEKLDLNKKYTVASHDYLLMIGGDGHSMFVGSKVLKKSAISDNELVYYIEKVLGGKITAEQYGKVRSSRIDVTEKPVVKEQIVEKEELKKAIGEAAKLAKNNYTEESWAKFQKTLDNAKTVLANEKATVEDVNEALLLLLDAKEALIEISKSPNTPIKTGDLNNSLYYCIGVITSLTVLLFLKKRKLSK